MKDEPHVFSRWRPHPWHGLAVGPNPPVLVNAYIEITAFDSVKYEIDKETGYLRVDRPQRTTSQPPTLYGFIPRTYCGRRVGKLMKGAQRGDGDPLDICVLCERPINKSEIILTARVVGGLPMIDHDEADDKLIAVIDQDFFWSKVKDISELPPVLIERLRHYFLTYKLIPGDEQSIFIGEAYGYEHAQKVVKAAIKDYQKEYISTLLSAV
jgi:inorganic pyrophosphatase